MKALGLIETKGLTAGITAADAAVKSANVVLLGREYARGGGLTTIKVEGDVGAVRAAVDAGSMAASQVGKVLSTHVIPRPDVQTEQVMVKNNRMVGGTLGAKPGTVDASKPEPKASAPKAALKTDVEPKKSENDASGLAGFVDNIKSKIESGVATETKKVEAVSDNSQSDEKAFDEIMKKLDSLDIQNKSVDKKKNKKGKK